MYTWFMFLDKVVIHIKAGDGGNGHTSFHRDKMTMRGGPNGGDGGRGGDVIFVGTTRVDNLIDFRFVKNYKGEDGTSGRPGRKDGPFGKAIEIPVPLGTKIFDSSGNIVADITNDGEQFVALKGGAGGRGNAHFATSRRQTPNFSQTGIKTKEHTVTLELNCIADVGIIGFPNVGKSTFLSIVTRSNPKIGNYPFTTLHPNIGVLASQRDHGAKIGGSVIFADIPGLVEGAHEGRGLGVDFLKHTARTRLFLHMIDISAQEGRDPFSDFEIINRELGLFSDELLQKPQIIVLNKIDSATTEQVKDFKSKIKPYLKNKKVFTISCATREGVDELLAFVCEQVAKLPRVEKTLAEKTLDITEDKNEFFVDIDEDGAFVVSGPMIDNLIRGVVLTDTESAAYFNRRLIKSGAVGALYKAGMQTGSTVRVKDIEFIWED